MKDKIRSKMEEVVEAIDKTDVSAHAKLFHLTQALDSLSGTYIRFINLGNYEEAQKANEQYEAQAFNDSAAMHGETN